MLGESFAEGVGCGSDYVYAVVERVVLGCVVDNVDGARLRVDGDVGLVIHGRV